MAICVHSVKGSLHRQTHDQNRDRMVAAKKTQSMLETIKSASSAPQTSTNRIRPAFDRHIDFRYDMGATSS